MMHGLQAFGPDSSQEEVYKETTQHLVESVLEGYNATVFAYGATGTVHPAPGGERDGGIQRYRFCLRGNRYYTVYVHSQTCL